MRARAALWIAGAVLLGACSSGSGSPGGDASSASGFCDGTFGALTRFLESRCTSADKQLDSYQFIAAFAQAIAYSCPSVLGKSIDGGRATLDAQAANACADGYEALLASAGIDSLSEPDPALVAACSGAIIGKQPPGAPCAQPYECQAGQTCVGFTPEADGTCQLPAVGQTCGAGKSESNELSVTFSFGDHPECAGEAFCETVYENGESFERCAAKLASGEACFDDEECQTGLACQNGVCSTSGPSAIGGACTSTEDCVDGAYCDESVCTAKKATGQPCEGSSLGGEECLGTCKVPEGATSGSCVSFCGSG